MFSFFRRKKKNIKQYIDYIDRKKINFQLNIGCIIDSEKQNRVDIQVFNQHVIEDFNYEILDKNGYMLMLSFNDKKYSNVLNFKRFKDSILYEKALFVDLYGETYLIRVENKENLIKSINFLLDKIFKYDEKTVIFTQFDKW